MTIGVEPRGESPPADGVSSPTEPEAGPPWWRLAALGVLLAAVLAVIYLSPLRGYLSRLPELREMIRGLGPLAPVVVTLGVAVLIAVGFPRLLFCVIAGMAMGFWWGLLWAQLGTLLGNYAVFLIARAKGGNWVRRYVAKRGKVAGLIHDEGIPGVILVRNLPIPGLLVNLTFGLLAIRQRDYLIGTLIGQLPQAIPCTLFGAGAVKASFAKSAGFIGLAVVFAVVVWIGLRWLSRWRRR